MSDPSNSHPLRNPFALLLVFLLLGYLLFSRSFAHLGIRPVYIGEVALATFLILKPSSLLRPWLTSLVRPTRSSAFSWWLGVSLAYGIFQCTRAIAGGDASLRVAEIFAYHVYPLYLFPGIWLAKRFPDFLPRFIPVFAWCHGLYGIVYMAVLSPLGLTVTLDDPTVVGWFGQPGFSGVAVLGLLAYWHGARRGFIPLLLNLLVMLGMQMRAVWLSFTIAVTLWAFMASRLKQLALCGLVVFGVLMAGIATDLRIPSPASRGGEISTREIVGRWVSAIDPELAAQVSTGADEYAGTVDARLAFWGGIWQQIKLDPTDLVFGLGYDFPMWQLYPGYSEASGKTVRSPHNLFMFVLGYSGFLGVLILLGIQFSLGRMMWRSFRDSGEAFGFCLWILIMVWVLFDPVLESPMGAIPLYILFGLVVGRTDSLVHDRDQVRRAGDRIG